MFDDTAVLAGGDKRIKQWSRVRESVIKLEVLVRLYKSLWDLGFGSTLDERLASDRTRRHLTGPSAKYEVERRLKEVSELKEVCWRNPQDVRKVIDSNLKSLKSGLRKAREEVVKLESFWAKSLNNELVIRIKEAAKPNLEKYWIDRKNENEAKLEWIKEKMKDYNKHFVCRWMREKLEKEKIVNDRNEVKDKREDNMSNMMRD